MVEESRVQVAAVGKIGWFSHMVMSNFKFVSIKWRNETHTSRTHTNHTWKDTKDAAAFFHLRQMCVM